MVVEVTTEIVIAIMEISFVTVLLPSNKGGLGGHYAGYRCVSHHRCYYGGGRAGDYRCGEGSRDC
jgi:hypothetical protein